MDKILSISEMTELGRSHLKWFWLYISMFNLSMIFISMSLGDFASNRYYYNSTLYQNAIIFIWGIGEILLLLLYIILALKNKVIILRK